MKRRYHEHPYISIKRFVCLDLIPVAPLVGIYTSFQCSAAPPPPCRHTFPGSEESTPTWVLSDRWMALCRASLSATGAQSLKSLARLLPPPLLAFKATVYRQGNRNRDCRSLWTPVKFLWDNAFNISRQIDLVPVFICVCWSYYWPLVLLWNMLGGLVSPQLFKLSIPQVKVICWNGEALFPLLNRMSPQQSQRAQSLASRFPKIK